MPEKYSVDYQTTTEVIREIAAAAGSQGMVGGQTVDILAERGQVSADVDNLRYIHANKTGAL